MLIPLINALCWTSPLINLRPLLIGSMCVQVCEKALHDSMHVIVHLSIIIINLKGYTKGKIACSYMVFPVNLKNIKNTIHPIITIIISDSAEMIVLHSTCILFAYTDITV